jgi:hypothetical protein
MVRDVVATCLSSMLVVYSTAGQQVLDAGAMGDVSTRRRPFIAGAHYAVFSSHVKVGA